MLAHFFLQLCSCLLFSPFGSLFVLLGQCRSFLAVKLADQANGLDHDGLGRDNRVAPTTVLGMRLDVRVANFLDRVHPLDNLAEDAVCGTTTRAIQARVVDDVDVELGSCGVWCLFSISGVKPPPWIMNVFMTRWKIDPS